MRIVSGKYKGIKLHGSSRSRTRPITNKAKERLFGFLGNDIADKRVLDLYAGTGAIGLEALSRECRNVTFVEINYFAYSVLHKNIELCNELNNSKIHNLDTIKFIKRVDETFDVIFSAPPYTREHYLSFLTAINKRPQILTVGGQIIVECNKHERGMGAFNNLLKVKEILHNDTIFEIWTRLEESTLYVQEQIAEISNKRSAGAN
ncbi:RsmD family RNA methyltransferase [Mucilaginibacter polytrichastri]|uniref:16S rRNA (Guanine(966)-N(2))-methyltransferase RsmD n=1 Tax=Mucilaginibacter polytrichastri TaxID=1302689 RepID=A0A1Q5ZS46_9SPHI|nr:RsmD family RNA methyltransferase [Mucilaginibacter polytrichastri]OKS84563.1 hypothetical protein RG47T_5253 [Mucilaginibacter polytrichastri]SFT24006.1 Conserved hypothetical protein 95 [Mucilaginibacter polytrichastri]